MSEATVTISLERYKQLEHIELDWKKDLAELKEKSNKRYEEICKDKTIIIDRGYSAFFDRYLVINPEKAADIINEKLKNEIARLHKQIIEISNNSISIADKEERSQELTKEIERSWYNKLFDLFK